MNTYAVIDFETTGLSPKHGARLTEIAVVLVKNDKTIDSEQCLMNPGVAIPQEISRRLFPGVPNSKLETLREARA